MTTYTILPRFDTVAEFGRCLFLNYGIQTQSTKSPRRLVNLQSYINWATVSDLPATHDRATSRNSPNSAQATEIALVRVLLSKEIRLETLIFLNHSWINEDVVMVADSGKMRGRSTLLILGALNVTKFILSFQRERYRHIPIQTVVKPINGGPSLVIYWGQPLVPFAVISLEVVQGKIQQILMVGGDKVSHI